MLQVHQRVQQQLLPVRAATAGPGAVGVANVAGGGEGLDVVDDEDEGRLLEGACWGG